MRPENGIELSWTVLADITIWPLGKADMIVCGWWFELFRSRGVDRGTEYEAWLGVLVRGTFSRLRDV